MDTGAYCGRVGWVWYSISLWSITHPIGSAPKSQISKWWVENCCNSLSYISLLIYWRSWEWTSNLSSVNLMFSATLLKKFSGFAFKFFKSIWVFCKLSKGVWVFLSISCINCVDFRSELNRFFKWFTINFTSNSVNSSYGLPKSKTPFLDCYFVTHYYIFIKSPILIYYTKLS